MAESWVRNELIYLSQDYFNGRECLFAGTDGRVNKPAKINLDSGLRFSGDVIMSSRYVKSLGKEDEISHDFEDPDLRDVSGNKTPVDGVLRDQSFRMSGTSVTFIRDVYITKTIDDIVDVMASVNFICAHFKLLFGKIKDLAGTFATWFSRKKEGKKEKEERMQNEREQDMKAIGREIARLQREYEALLLAQQTSAGRGGHTQDQRIAANRSEVAGLQQNLAAMTPYQ